MSPESLPQLVYFLTNTTAFLRDVVGQLPLHTLGLWFAKIGPLAFPLGFATASAYSWGRWRQDEALYQRLQRSMERIDAMLEFDRQNAMAYWMKGELFEIQAQYSEALRCYRMAHQLCPAAYQYAEWINTSRRVHAYLEGRSRPPPYHWLQYSHSF
jgi:hypothetical protein